MLKLSGPVPKERLLRRTQARCLAPKVNNNRRIVEIHESARGRNPLTSLPPEANPSGSKKPTGACAPGMSDAVSIFMLDLAYWELREEVVMPTQQVISHILKGGRGRTAQACEQARKPPLKKEQARREWPSSSLCQVWILFNQEIKTRKNNRLFLGFLYEDKTFL